MSALPPIVPGSGYNVTFRQRVKGSKSLAFAEIYRAVASSPNQKYIRQDLPVRSFQNGTSGVNKKLYYTLPTTVFNKTKIMGPPNPRLYGTVVNPDTVIFVSFADAMNYNKINTMITKFVTAGLLEVISSVVVP